MAELNLPPKAENALHRLQDTALSPMEEALFKAWTKANKIDKPDDPNDTIDYRGIYKETNGMVLPYGQLRQQTEAINHRTKLESALQERLMKRIEEMAGKKEDAINQEHKEQRQDITHKQKMEMESMKLKRAPHDLKMKEHDVKGKEIDIQKQRLGLDQQRLGNEGKELDLVAALLQPQRTGAESPKTPSNGSSNPKE